MFKKINFLSPPITLFHLERRTHTSKIGGCLVLLMISIILTYITFLIFNLVNHKKITSIFHKKFEYEAGYYSFNSSSIFHFIQIFSPDDGGYFDKYESKYIRAYTTYVHSNFSYGNLDLYDHWVFDACRKDIDDKDLEPYLFENIENFTNAVCIRHYYNSTQKRYYSLGEKGFYWPYLEHGTSQRNNIYLTTIIQKCSNDSIINKLFGECPSQKEIDNYVSKYFGIYLYFTDIQVDPTNYDKPVQKYLQVISTGIGTSQTFVESYIHFSPLRIKTKFGNIFSKTRDINSFYFDFNRKGAANNYNEKYFTLTKYYHLMQNNVQIYERRYDNLLDIFSEIGGEIQFIFYFFYWINYGYNKFIIAYDTNSLFFTIRDEELNNKDNRSDSNNSILNKKHHNKLYNTKSDKLNISKFKKIDIKNNREILKSSQINKTEDKKLFENTNDKSLNEKEKIENYQRNKIKVNNINFNYLNCQNLNKNIDFVKIIPKKGKNYNDYNCSNIILKDNDNNNIEIINKFKNMSSFDLDKKIKLNKEKDKDKEKDKEKEKKTKKKENRISNKNIINNICVSKGSITKIVHKKLYSSEIYNENNKFRNYFSFLDFIKSFFIKQNKGSHNFLTLFRKHLLSEEHLLKSHINIILLEKKYKICNEECTNIYECYNDL